MAARSNSSQTVLERRLAHVRRLHDVSGDGLLNSWHVELAQVVEAALERGGEAALFDIVRRFRAAFQDSLNPRFLPAGWSVDHECVPTPQQS